MPVQINHRLCNGCGNSGLARCVRICPGDLLYKTEEKKIVVRNYYDCWDCAACVKECPQQAIELYLPGDQRETKVSLTAKIEGDSLEWNLHKGKEKVEKIKLKCSGR